MQVCQALHSSADGKFQTPIFKSGLKPGREKYGLWFVVLAQTFIIFLVKKNKTSFPIPGQKSVFSAFSAWLFYVVIVNLAILSV